MKLRKLHRLDAPVRELDPEARRRELEAKSASLNAAFKTLTPAEFPVPKKGRALSPDLQIPDTEILRQLLQQKADIAEEYSRLPVRKAELPAKPDSFQVAAKKRILK